MGCLCKSKRVNKIVRVDLDSDTHVNIKPLTSRQYLDFHSKSKREDCDYMALIHDVLLQTLVDDEGKPAYDNVDQLQELPLSLLMQVFDKVKEVSGTEKKGN